MRQIVGECEFDAAEPATALPRHSSNPTARALQSNLPKLPRSSRDPLLCPQPALAQPSMLASRHEAANAVGGGRAGGRGGEARRLLRRLLRMRLMCRAALPYSSASRQAIREAQQEACRLGSMFVAQEHLLLAISGSDCEAGRLLSRCAPLPCSAGRRAAASGALF